MQYICIIELLQVKVLNQKNKEINTVNNNSKDNRAVEIVSIVVVKPSIWVFWF